MTLPLPLPCEGREARAPSPEGEGWGEVGLRAQQREAERQAERHKPPYFKRCCTGRLAGKCEAGVW
jgi:hypothetical protein